MIVAMLSREELLRRASSSASLMFAPAVRSSSSPPASICHTCRIPSRFSARTAARMACSWWDCSAKAATAPESPRFQATWLGEEVS